MKITKLTILAALLIIASALNGQQPQRDQAKEQKILEKLRSIDSSSVKYFREATDALDQNNFSLADSLYTLVYNKVPNYDVVARRLGAARFYSGKVHEGIELCEKAIELNKSAYNYLSLANCYFTTGDSQNLDSSWKLLKEAQKLPDGDDPDIITMMGQIALQQNDTYEFRTATSILMEKHPELMVSHYFAAILASVDEKWEDAYREIHVAEKMGLPSEAVKTFLDSGVGSKVSRKHFIHYLLWIMVLWVAGLILLYVFGKLLSAVTMRSLEKQDVNAAPGEAKSFLRSVYKFLINFGGIYYYISLPIILVLVIVLVVAVFYFFLFIGRIPLQLMAILIIGSLFTIYGMIRSLLVKVDTSDPGRELKREEAPSLYKMAEDVASAIGTRPIDEIRITPTTDLAVYERGSWREKMQDKGRRILILGVGVLKEFNQNDFKAVLAHEYGHFSHRDTAGGDVALRVRNDMTKYFYALYGAGQNVWWNLAFHFLRLYNFIFRRISHGSTRLQEILADRVAAQTFGMAAFQNGLTYVIKRDIEFNVLANKEIELAKNAQRSFYNLYELQNNDGLGVDEELQKALNRETSEDDTHPSPVDRFKYISGVRGKNPSESTAVVPELFVNWEAITDEMTRLIEDYVKKG